MKQVLCGVLFVLSTVFATVALHATPQETRTPAPVAGIIKLTQATQTVETASPYSPGVLRLAPELFAQSLPNCGYYDWSYCPTPGTRIKCQWSTGEYGQCYCLAGYKWGCG